ncbi:hypothetical protein GGQ64_005559 [Rhizobium azooxidifex]|uniref:Uncharacterized protein n=1 Tax=Mycoplana azooxidifex TaxID=1636188 RepID=A0A7W6DFG8_9HYPH|nr:hypothetical protein [Mycoplana azooxidifex]MBB3980306.1 hypothetical protein [Mycoplana azooxidifex]
MTEIATLERGDAYRGRSAAYLACRRERLSLVDHGKTNFATGENGFDAIAGKRKNGIRHGREIADLRGERSGCAPLANLRWRQLSVSASEAHRIAMGTSRKTETLLMITMAAWIASVSLGLGGGHAM